MKLSYGYGILKLPEARYPNRFAHIRVWLAVYWI